MAFEPSTVVSDACVLYLFHVRNIIVQAAVDRLIEARWTDEIHDEWMRSLAADTPTIPIERLQATRLLMNNALPGATVSVYQDLVPTVQLPDPDDRHVVAAAIASGASIILTWNLRDFPVAALKAYGLRRQAPDGFLADLFDAAPDLMVASLANARRNLNRTRVSAADFIDMLIDQKLGRLARQVRGRLSAL